jgi:hypothetical protein
VSSESDHAAIRRSSVVSLIGALVLSTLFYPYLLFLFALSAEGDSAGWIVFVFGAPLVGWLILAAYIGRMWWKGWTRVWKIPVLGLMGAMFWPALFLLFSKGVRRALLPGRPWQPGGYCQDCGTPWPPDARYCQQCGAARPQMTTG